MKKIFVIASIVVVIAVIAEIILTTRSSPSENSGKVNVVASFYPLAHFAEEVGGSHLNVYNLTPVGAEPHDFEPTPQDIVKLRNAQLILLNGAGFEPWFESMQKTDSQKLATIKMEDHVKLLTDASGTNDPHIWLDPLLAVEEVEAIRDKLMLEDPIGNFTYEKNAAEYIGKLKKLDEWYATGLSSCRIRSVISPHSAFNYLGNRYNIEFIGISGLSPDQEPSPQRLAELANIAKAKAIKIIFFEELASPKLAQTIAKEAGVEAAVLNPIEGLTAEDVQTGENYISLMEKNLVELRLAMECE